MNLESPAANQAGAPDVLLQFGRQGVADVVANVRQATLSRTGFTAIMALFSLTVLPAWCAAAWFGFIAAWELLIRIRLENALALPAAERCERTGFRRLAAIHMVGASAYSIYPLLAWSPGEPIGMVLATAWVCGSANHLFVYFSANWLLLASCLGPLALTSIAAPFTTAHFDLATAVAVATLVCLIVAAGMFGFDRQLLLGNLAKQAAARAVAEEANAAKSQFLTTMSHELRTPLNAVIGYAELIEEEAGHGPIAEDAVKIRASARQLLSVIDVILDLSKLETGAAPLQRERGDVSGVLQQLHAAALPIAAAANNTLTIIEATPLGEAEIDHVRLHQCLMQLISNAAKFTKDGAIRVTASRVPAETGEHLLFEIADNGIGIAAEQQGRIFEPFAQADETAGRRYEGAGLGLTLVRRLARLMGGDVSCESTLGAGSVFRLWVAA